MHEQQKNSHLIFIAGTALVVVLVFIFGFRSQKAEAPATTPIVENGDVAAGSAVTDTTSTTGTQKPATVKTPVKSPPAAVTPAGSTVMTYRSSGFEPRVLEVKRGQSVHFVNKSGSAMRLVSNTADGQRPYLGFDQSKTVGSGGSYDFTFNEPGTWGIKNQFDSVHFGAVAVQ